MGSSKKHKNLAGQTVPGLKGTKIPSRYRHKAFCPRDHMDRHKLSERESHLFEHLIHYKKNKKIHTHLISGSWGYVIALAIIYAIAINTVKVIVYENFWKPSWVIASEME